MLVHAESQREEDNTPQTITLDAGTKAEMEEEAHILLKAGLHLVEDVERQVAEIADFFDQPVPTIIKEIVATAREPVLQEREQWSEDTDTDIDKILEVFANLIENANIITKFNFSCCSRCAGTKIRSLATPGQVGYCFFHEQDTDQAVKGQGLYIRYSALCPDRRRPEEKDEVAVGKAVASRLRDKGLEVDWNEDPGQPIKLPYFNWVVLWDLEAPSSKEEKGKEEEDDDDNNKERSFK
ncbi:uncharacterized protein BJX67DRAFT_385412 [Aspergillus lucknowensis]|uniref:DUF6891 domain-containing protein n=1 Tax=Aspergillus lucknowensis TaxID=176173 RepID=A0ABR4LDW0_9EURO